MARYQNRYVEAVSTPEPSAICYQTTRVIFSYPLPSVPTPYTVILQSRVVLTMANINYMKQLTKTITLFFGQIQTTGKPA